MQWSKSEYYSVFHAQPSHNVSRWHCLPFKRSKTSLPLALFPLISLPLSSPLLSLFPFSASSFLSPTSLCPSVPLSSVSRLTRGSGSGPQHVLGGLVILSELQSNMCGTRLFAPAQSEAAMGQFVKPSSSCGEFPLREASLSGQTHFMD